MAGFDTRRLESLEPWSPTLFLVAGGLFVVYAAIHGIQAFTEAAASAPIFGPGGFALGFLGLLGLYPTFASWRPRVVHAGAVCAALGAVGFFLVLSTSLFTLTGGELPDWCAGFIVPAAIGMFAGFAVFAAAALRSEAAPRTLGLLLSVPPVVFGANIVGVEVLGPETIPVWSAFIASGHALAYLSIGVTLRTEGVPAGPTESPADTAPGELPNRA